MNNRIPRKFNRITGIMLINNNLDKVGDILHVYKNDLGYLSLNTRTNQYGYCFASMLRNPEIFEFVNVEV